MNIIDILVMIFSLGIWAIISFFVLMLIPRDDDDDEDTGK